MKDKLYEGKVKQYHADKGYGFITAPEGEVFFHVSDFPADHEPKRNERVKFQVIKNGEKYKAVKIQLVQDHSTKARKAKAVTTNQAITSHLLSNFKR